MEKEGVETKEIFKHVWNDAGEFTEDELSLQDWIDITVEELGDALTVAAEGMEETALNMLYGQLEAAGIEGAAAMSEEELLAAILLLDAEVIATM